MAPLFKVKAVYEYTSEHDDDLKFPIGQVINVLEEEGDDWYVGEYTDAAGAKQEGMFPRNFVEKYEPEVPTRPVRPSRPKAEAQPTPAAAIEPETEETEPQLPAVQAASKPQAPPVEIPAATSRREDVTSPQSATSPRLPVTRAEPPAAPKPAPAEPAASAATPSKAKPPPPVAPKTNAFKDRIAAFNRAEAAPIAPMQPGRQQQRNDYIKKPFVAAAPSSNAYIPPAQKVEPIHRPYVREEDPEIRQRQEEDRAAAEAAGLTGSAPTVGGEEGEQAPKPMSLKERMAMLQREQEAQRARHAEVSQKRERKPPPKKPSESSEYAQPIGGEEAEHEPAENGEADTRRSLDVAQERPRVPSAQRRAAEPMSPVPAVPAHEILSGGEEADQSAAGEDEDDAGTIGPDDSDEKLAHAPRAPAAPLPEPDVGDEEDTTEETDEPEEELDEEEQRKQRLRERMARLAGGPGVGPFNPFNPSASAPPTKKRSTRDTTAGEEGAPSSPPVQHQMVAIPGMGGAPMQRMQSPDSDQRDRGVRHDTGAEVDEDVPAPPSRRSMAEDRAAAPPVPKGKISRKLVPRERNPVMKEQSALRVLIVSLHSTATSFGGKATADVKLAGNRPVPPAASQERVVPPPLPSESTRPVPRPPPAESRPVPPPPPAAEAPLSPGPGSESDDEMSMHAKRSSAETPGVETPLPVRMGAPPVPTSREVPPRPPQSPDHKRASYFSSEPSSATSDRRSSRVPPPIPGGSPLSSPRPPPPPPPAVAPPSRRTTGLEPPDDTERGESDYEGDYDTDIASSAKHKDALKSHNREPSLDDSTTADEMTPITTPAPHMAPRAVPPPPPPGARPSTDAPRAPPPRLPAGQNPDDVDYDPYRYDSNKAMPPVPGAVPMNAPPIPPEPTIQDDSSADNVPGVALSRKSTERAPPPPPNVDRPPPMPPAPQQAPTPARPRQSGEVQRTPTMGRRSMDQARPSGEHHGQMAHDIDLGQATQWWTAPQPLPPVLQSRNGVDILSESEESQKSKRGGRTTISKDVYVLYMDYSQTIITAQYDSREPSDVSLEQRHEPPPSKLRQDQLEAYWQRFGTKIAEAANAAGNTKKDSVVADGTPYALPFELIKAQPDALLPVGTRAYGALVYANLANASTMQFDEIRPGDIITVRNAKFEGHHGTMRQKYKQDYGPNHVAVVEEWDGTRRSVRAWEQGREKKGGVRSEKFRLGDLRSGEVRVWRVVGRDWVGWAE